ncbi:MAG: class I SAM-dependent methyltransferase [Bacteroidota bacterium]|nr:class I SAM-dependent methyltransferase [Bacteroidota bacterium]
MSWFKSWFNSPYYHILYKNRDEREAEIFLDHLIAYFNPNPNARILDLACGKGRHAVYLNEKGFEVTGIDLSEESIQFCRQFENDRLSFFVHDMRNLFRVNDFDFVFNLFTSFGYFEKETENIAAIKNACLSLKKGGKLVIDFFNSNYVVEHLVPFDQRIINGISFTIAKRIENGFLLKEISFNDGGKPYLFTEKVALLGLNDFERYLLPCGMKITGLLGDYDLHEWDPGNSQRLIVVAEKNI